MFYRLPNKLIYIEWHVTIPRRYHASHSGHGWGVACSHEGKQDYSLDLSEENLKIMIKKGHEMKDVIKVGRRGACDTLVVQIQKRWNTSKIVKLHCSGKPSNNMKQLAIELEDKTKGVVIFRSGGTIILHKSDE